MQDEITCEDFVEMAPAYALEAVDEAERMALARHLAQPGPHRGCSEAVAEAVQVTSRLSEALPEQAPSPRLWRAIEARITDKPAVAVRRRSSVRELGGWCVAVAAVVVGVYLYKLPSDRGRRSVAQDRGQLTERPLPTGSSSLPTTPARRPRATSLTADTR
jgi:anti-sigma-K factor RskA